MVAAAVETPTPGSEAAVPAPADPTATAVAAPEAETPVVAPEPATPAAVDRGPWGDVSWQGVYDAPALLDRVRDRLRKEAPWLAAGVWVRKGRVGTPFELAPAAAELRVALAGLALRLGPAGCTIELPVVSGQANAPSRAECAEFLRSEATLGAWLWLLARGADNQFDVQIETMKLAPERGEADVVVFSQALGSRVRIVLTAGQEWLRLDRPDSPESLSWRGAFAEINTRQQVLFRLTEAPKSGPKSKSARDDGRGWLWIAVPDSKEVAALQAAAEKARTVMDGLPRFRLLRQDGVLRLAQAGAPVDAAPDGVLVVDAPVAKPPLAVVALEGRGGLAALLDKLALPADLTCVDLMPRGVIPGTQQQAIVVVPCEGPAKLP